MSRGASVALVFVSGMVAAGALNQIRWAIWPLSGGPAIGSDPRTAWQLFGWLGGPPGFGRPLGWYEPPNYDRFHPTR